MYSISVAPGGEETRPWDGDSTAPLIIIFNPLASAPNLYVFVGFNVPQLFIFKKKKCNHKINTPPRQQGVRRVSHAHTPALRSPSMPNYSVISLFISHQLCFLASNLSGQVVRHCWGKCIERGGFRKAYQGPGTCSPFKSCHLCPHPPADLPSSQRRLHQSHTQPFRNDGLPIYTALTTSEWDVIIGLAQYGRNQIKARIVSTL